MEPNALWRQVWLAFMGRNREWLVFHPTGSSKNRPWFDIAKMMPVYGKFIRFNVGNGTRISFWMDKWLGESYFKDDFLDIFNISLKQNATVADCWDEEEITWNLGI